jgi:hypothetical protein
MGQGQKANEAVLNPSISKLAFNFLAQKKIQLRTRLPEP